VWEIKIITHRIIGSFGDYGYYGIERFGENAMWLSAFETENRY